MAYELEGIAKKLGIAVKFSDGGLVHKEYDVGAETIRFFIETFGYKADNETDIANSLHKLENARWQQTLENVYVVPQDNIEFDIVVPEEWQNEYFDVRLFAKGEKTAEKIAYEISSRQEAALIKGKNLRRLYVRITSPVKIGYYDIELSVKGKKFKTILAVAPIRCYEPPAMERKLWGFAVQLYSVKSNRNWGVGDFTDLENIVRICGRTGASVIGLNPLNVLMHNFPENASPYSSISRLFLNPIYIDVERVPEFEENDLQLIEGTLAELRNSELIQYGKVYPLKISVLEKCYQRFKSGKDKNRQDAFKKFCREQGLELERLAVFQTLYDKFSQEVWGGWTAWPAEYRNPRSSEVKKFAEEQKDRVEFFKYLQFEADRQFSAAADVVKEQGLGIGFYRDLAVGVGKDSAEVWGNPEVYIKDAGAGAPPDAFFPGGQKWCLGAFEPRVLKEQCYEPFIKILRANMKNAGALRMDHVMSLMRLFVIPDNGLPGTYIFYNFADMLNIVALESHLNRCAIVGECIGNVPEGFMDVLHERNIHPLSVLWSERGDNGWGDFFTPSEYPKAAFASVGTHDMAPLKMWWYGYDIELSFSLGLIPDEEAKTGAYHKRELDRWKLLFAMDSNGVWPEDRPRGNNFIYGEGYPEGLVEAVHRFMSRTASQVFLAMPEDILYVEKQQNLPGTDRDKHPNWRRKLPVPLERLESDIAYIRAVEAIKKER